jgi:phage gp46-like protein
MITTGGDIALGESDVLLDESILSAVLVSLFCDANADDLLPGERRGYWADEDAQRPVGSLLWVLDRAKATQETRARARDAAEDSLRWMIDEGIAEQITVDATYERPDFLRLDILITRGTSRRHQSLWDAFEETVYPWEGGALRLRGN